MMNYLFGKKVYLTGPIHSVNDDGASWREIVTPRLKSIGLDVLDPCKKAVNNDAELSEVGKAKEKFRSLVCSENWDLVKKDFWPIVRCDLRMIDHCDFLIFNYDPLVPMVGTIHELVVATFEKKVVLLKYDKSQLKDFNPWIATFIKSHHFFSDWESMFKHLNDVNDGVFDTSLWVV